MAWSSLPESYSHRLQLTSILRAVDDFARDVSTHDPGSIFYNSEVRRLVSSAQQIERVILDWDRRMLESRIFPPEDQVNSLREQIHYLRLAIQGIHQYFKFQLSPLLIPPQGVVQAQAQAQYAVVPSPGGLSSSFVGGSDWTMRSSSRGYQSAATPLTPHPPSSFSSMTSSLSSASSSHRSSTHRSSHR